MILSRGNSILALVGLLAVASFLVAENPKADRAKKLAELFDALDTTDAKDYAKARDAVRLAVERGRRSDVEAVAKAAKDKRPLIRALEGV